MSQTAKIFINGRSQAVRLPRAFRFETQEVYVRQDAATGDVILSRKPSDWDDFIAAIGRANALDDFLGPDERQTDAQARDPFEGWRE